MKTKKIKNLRKRIQAVATGYDYAVLKRRFCDDERKIGRHEQALIDTVVIKSRKNRIMMYWKNRNSTFPKIATALLYYEFRKEFEEAMKADIEEAAAAAKEGE